MPGDHRNPAPCEALEQCRAPAVPVEDQLQGGFDGVGDGEIRHDPVPAAGSFSSAGRMSTSIGPVKVGSNALSGDRKGYAAKRVEPVARGGRQTELLARHIVPRASEPLRPEWHLDVALHRQEWQTPARVVRHPSRREAGWPVSHTLHVPPQRLDLAAKCLHLQAAVEAQAGTPLPVRQVLQRYRIAQPGQGEKGQKLQKRATARSTPSGSESWLTSPENPAVPANCDVVIGFDMDATRRAFIEALQRLASVSGTAGGQIPSRERTG